MTLITVTVVSCAAVFSWRTALRLPGMRLFAFGLLSMSVGAALGIGSAFGGGHPILLACNAFLCAGVAAAAQGVRLLRGRRLIGVNALACCAFVVASLFCYWMFGRDNFAVRMAITSCANGLMCADAAISLLRRSGAVRDRTVHRATGVAFTATASTLAVRSVGTLAGFYGATPWTAGPVEVAVSLMINADFIACVVGVVLCASAQLRHESEQMALFDPLTGLPNRRCFFERLAAAEQRATATGGQLGVIYTDLDGFKQINDVFGHDKGDLVLKTLGKAMARVLRPGDCLARIGGDEFVVLIERAESRVDLVGLAQRIKAAVEREPACSGLREPLRLSCGVAMFPEDGETALALMQTADAAMYRAKRAGRPTHTTLDAARDVRAAAMQTPVANF